ASINPDSQLLYSVGRALLFCSTIFTVSNHFFTWTFLLSKTKLPLNKAIRTRIPFSSSTR
ncbi:MAG: hypothetical protein O7C59_10315, partial [Rickettsia endosymbiont of Ixodes persulcatus]|nr:hypothetical protein [Rickettsia endosymbiont of Ixodes persulcatus]